MGIVSRICTTVLLILLLQVAWPPVSASPQAGVAPPPEAARVLDALHQGGLVVLLRHSATEPGVGDPPGFDLKDCATQRNLSEAGREQARRLGRWFQANGIAPTAVRASPWCRARETAMLAFGQSEDWAPLSNLFADRSGQHEQVRQVREAIAAVGSGDVDILVSHGVSINAFIGVYLAQGELVVVRPSGGTGVAGVEVVGRLLLP